MSNIIPCQALKQLQEENEKEDNVILIAKKISKQLAICKEYKRVEKTQKNRWLFHIGTTNQTPHARLELFEDGAICWSFYGKNENDSKFFKDYNNGTKELIKRFLKYE